MPSFWRGVGGEAVCFIWFMFISSSSRAHRVIRVICTIVKADILYNVLLITLPSLYNLRIDLTARKLTAISVVAGGYGGDMPEDQAYDLLDDIDFYYNKVKCRKIEKLLPVLNKLVIEELKLL